MEAINSFEGGINRDTSELLKNKNTYIDALNVDLVLDELNGSFVLSNSKGNKLMSSIPSTSKIVNISSTGTASYLNFIINNNNSVQTSVINVPPNTSNQQLSDLLKSSNAYILNKDYVSIYFNESNVVIVPNGQGIDVSFSGNTSSIIQNTIKNIPETVLQYPIGYTNINDELYIISTTCNSSDSSVITSSGYGFIWKFDYDKINYDPSLSKFTLIYAANLNMSTYYHIPRTGIVGRYETSKTKKIWWTDNYNPIRYLNVANPNVFAEDPTTLAFNSVNDFSRPKLLRIEDSGAVAMNTGLYYSAYRLRKTQGNTTIISELSNPVAIGAGTIGGSYNQYTGSTGGTTPKTIVWEVSNIDTDFDFIDFIVIKKENGGYGNWTSKDIYTITKVSDEQINNRTTITFSFSYEQIAAGESLTLEDMSSFSEGALFTHAKSIAEKDQYLIAANIRNENSNGFINYDARAFRSDSSGKVLLKNNDIQFDLSLDEAMSLAKTEDCINEYDTSRECLYKPGTSVLGGKGKNIEYEFYTVSVLADEIPVATGFVHTDLLPLIHTSKSNSDFNLMVKSGSNNESYNLFNFHNDIKNPQLSGNFIGYTRGEIYRFGLQFFDKNKRPLFVEWIGDIKFPDHFDKNNNSYFIDGSSAGLTNFITSSTINGKQYTHQLGIKFTLNNINDISSKIGGYSIVRMQRTNSDKRIIVQGFVNSALTSFGGDSGRVWAAGGWYENYKRSFFHCPSLGNSDKIPSIGNNIDYKYKSQSLGTSNFNTLTSVDGGDTYWVKNVTGKYYTLNRYDSFKSVINEVRYVTGEEIVGNSTNFMVLNRSPRVPSRKIGVSDRYINYGLPSYYIETANGILNENSYDGSERATYQDYFYNDFLGIANITRELSNQYNGNNYNARSKSQYISCNHFRAIFEKTQVPQSETFLLFGGDTYVNLYDTMLFRKDWGNPDETRSRSSHVVVVPLETNVNTSMVASFAPRYNWTKAFDDSKNNTASAYYENYFPVFSSENNINYYYSQPNEFDEVDTWVNRFAHSDQKINGENTESWANFKLANVWDVEGTNGEINAILPFNDSMYFWQDKAFGRMMINTRAALTDTSGGGISQIYTGLPQTNILQRHEYVSNIAGTKYSNSIIKAVTGLYWIDSNNKKLYKFDGKLEPLSDTKGLYSYFINSINIDLDKPHYINNGIHGISSGYDTKRNKLYFTIHNGEKSYTIGYNEKIGAFLSFYSFKPSLYLDSDSDFLSFNSEDIYLHEKSNYGEYYGIKEKSYIKFIVNDNPSATKIFDNLHIISESLSVNGENQNKDTWNRIRITNNYQNTDFQDLVYNSNLRRIERKFNLDVPRNRVLYTNNDSPNIYTDLSQGEKDYGERIRDRFINIELEYDNVDSNNLKTTLISTNYRVSIR